MVGGSFLRQLERDRDRGRQGRENGQRAMLWTDGQRGEHVEREPFPVKGSVIRCCTTRWRRCLAARKIESRARWLPAINNAPPVGDCQTVKTGELHNIS